MRRASTMATCTSAPSASALARRSTLINGNGVAVSVRGYVLGRTVQGRRRRLMRPAGVGFEVAWHALLPKVPEGGFDEWRDQRDFIASNGVTVFPHRLNRLIAPSY